MRLSCLKYLESTWRRYETLDLFAIPMPSGRPYWPQKPWQTGTQLRPDYINLVPRVLSLLRAANRAEFFHVPLQLCPSMADMSSDVM